MGTVDEEWSWDLFHAINSAVATRDWIEDPVTLLGGAAVDALRSCDRRAVVPGAALRRSEVEAGLHIWPCGSRSGDDHEPGHLSPVGASTSVRDASGVHAPPLGTLPRSLLPE